MTSCEVWICDACASEEREEIGDGPPPGWAKNVEDDDFCPKCAKMLDPYDPETAALSDCPPHWEVRASYGVQDGPCG